MPRYYAKKIDKVNYAAVLEGIKQILLYKKSIRAVARSHNLANATLARYVRKIQAAAIDVSTSNDDVIIAFIKSITVPGAKTIFSRDQEQMLMKYVLQASDVYYGLSISELKTLAFQFAKSIKCHYPDSWNENDQASKDWYYSFMSRNPQLSLRTPEQISQNRAKAFCKENVDAFFENYRSVLNSTTFEAHRIWNMDETGLPTVPTKAEKIGSSTSAERGTNVSMALAVSATGTSIPPFLILPRKQMKAVFMTHASHGASAVANGSGWMTSEVFKSYMEHFIKYSGAQAGSPTLLLIDNHTSHLSIDIIEMAIAHDITMLSFPPHCTHRMQPLDISVFGPLKTMYAKQHDDWTRSNMNVIFDLHHVPLILEKCLDVAATPKNIKAGFKASGIFPFDAHVFTDVDFVASQLSSKNQSDDHENEEEDNQRRIIITAADVFVAHEEVCVKQELLVSSDED